MTLGRQGTWTISANEQLVAKTSASKDLQQFPTSSFSSYLPSRRGATNCYSMHYVKYTQKAIVSCLPTAAPGSTLRTVLSSSRQSPRLRNHAVTPQINRKYRRGLSSEGTGSANPGGDALELFKAAIPTTGSTRSANRSNTKARDGDSALESLRAAMPTAGSPSQPGPSANAPNGDPALQSLLSIAKPKPTTSQPQPSAVFERKRHDYRAEKRIKGVAYDGAKLAQQV